MSEGPSELEKADAPRTAEAFATWLSLFGVSPAGTPEPGKPATPKKRARSERAPSTGDETATS
jgi:hypothetical protein